jgi:hypothetical protein
MLQIQLHLSSKRQLKIYIMTINSSEQYHIFMIYLQYTYVVIMSENSSSRRTRVAKLLRENSPQRIAYIKIDKIT